MDVKKEELVEIFTGADQTLNEMLVNFERYSEKFTESIDSMSVGLYETLESFRLYFVSRGLDVPETPKPNFFDQHILSYHDEKNESFVRQIEEYQVKFKNLHDKIFDGAEVDTKDITEESMQDVAKLFSEFQAFSQKVGQAVNDQRSLKNMRSEQASKDINERQLTVGNATAAKHGRSVSIPAAFSRRK